MKRTTLLLTLCFPAVAAQAGNLLVNPGFETPEGTSGGYPTSTGDWNGDWSEIVTEENGVSPAEGIRMHRFLGSSFFGASPAGFISNLVQLYQGPELRPGNTLTAAALFNRISESGDPSSPIDTEFRIRIHAHTGTPSSYDFSGFIGEGIESILSDNDPLTWEMASTSLLLPAETTYVAVVLEAVENVFNDPILPEFHGHYADAVTLALVPEPATALLLTLVAPTVLCRRRRPL